VILFKVSLSLGIELASSMTRPGANSCVPAAGSRATGLPTEVQPHDCNLQRVQALARAKGLSPCLTPLVLPTV
jgi:hypothetical protein